MAKDLSAEGAGRSDRIQIAIVGGGCAGMAAAWQLSKQEGYEIHVYEKGWRLAARAHQSVTRRAASLSTDSMSGSGFTRTRSG